jgi:hypothetical protein
MFCQTCVDEGRKSQIEVKPGGNTLLATRQFYDDSGRFHRHDTNYYTEHYRCTNGHEWTGVTRSICEPCGAVQEPVY